MIEPKTAAEALGNKLLKSWDSMAGHTAGQRNGLCVPSYAIIYDLFRRLLPHIGIDPAQDPVAVNGLVSVRLWSATHRLKFHDDELSFTTKFGPVWVAKKFMPLGRFELVTSDELQWLSVDLHLNPVGVLAEVRHYQYDGEAPVQIGSYFIAPKAKDVPLIGIVPSADALAVIHGQISNRLRRWNVKWGVAAIIHFFQLFLGSPRAHKRKKRDHQRHSAGAHRRDIHPGQVHSAKPTAGDSADNPKDEAAEWFAFYERVWDAATTAAGKRRRLGDTDGWHFYTGVATGLTSADLHFRTRRKQP